MDRRSFVLCCGSALVVATFGGALWTATHTSERAWRHGSAGTGPPARPAGGPPGVPLSVPGLLQERRTPLAAQAGVAIEGATGRILAEHQGFDTLPIASLTKLMTAMVALDRHVNLRAEITMRPEEYTVGGNLRVAPNTETVTVRDALYASITGSANNATLALARSTGLSPTEFVQEMNRKAIVLGLEDLHFVDPTGLSPENVGSAYAVAVMAAAALTDYPLIRDAARRASYTVVTRNTRREHVVKNPNLLFERAKGQFLASKTGYLEEAKYCLVLARETASGLVVAVTLGHPSERGSEEETLALLNEGTQQNVSSSTPKDAVVH